jgi:hypothetical protein
MSSHEGLYYTLLRVSGPRGDGGSCPHPYPVHFDLDNGKEGREGKEGKGRKERRKEGRM